MLVNGAETRTIWTERRPHADDPGAVGIIDQTRLPHRFETLQLVTLDDAARAIAEMWVRGAPLIGATAAYGMALALHRDASDAAVATAHDRLASTRPTAVNLRWALDRVAGALQPLPVAERRDAAWQLAEAIVEEDVEINRRIGAHGLPLLRALAEANGGRVNVLTHCNAGWLATSDWGTATSPIYQAHDAGIDVHVWVDETRPRNQGAALTAWELQNHGVPHHVIVDNAGGHLMRQGLVDIVVTGTDRVTANGDVCNKIGTYLKALAAWDNGVPFYVALPTPTIDPTLASGDEIEIEARADREVTHVWGRRDDGVLAEVQLTPDGTPGHNPAFDVTPARLVTGLITEKGVIAAEAGAIAGLFPDRSAA